MCPFRSGMRGAERPLHKLFMAGFVEDTGTVGGQSFVSSKANQSHRRFRHPVDDARLTSV
jgi:hypothetical protein